MLTYREEDKDVAFRLCSVNLEDSSYGSVKVVSFRLWRIMNIDGKQSTWD